MHLLLKFKITRGPGSAEEVLRAAQHVYPSFQALPLLLEPRLQLRGHHLRQLSTRVSYHTSTPLSRPYRSNWSLGYIRDGIIGGGLSTACARAADGSPVAWAVEYNDGRCAKGCLLSCGFRGASAHPSGGSPVACAVELLNYMAGALRGT